MKTTWWAAIVLGIALAVGGCGVAKTANTTAKLATVSGQAQTPANIDPGTPLKGEAPSFTLTDQFGKPVSLSQYRGKVVVLAFLDSRCTTICPVTSEEMVMAKHMLGEQAAAEVQLVAVDANPTATAVSDVYSYSKAHGVLHQWVFLTGGKSQLAKVWKDYHIYVAIQHGAIDHTPGVYILNAQGQERRLYLTQMAYNGLGQQAQVFAQELARQLPHPTPASAAVLHEAAQQEAQVHSLARVKLPLVSTAGLAGSTVLGNHQPHLLVFTASWLQQLSNVPAQLEDLNTYQQYAKVNHLPSLVVVDEAPTEPSSKAFPTVLQKAPHLHFPVAVDINGAVASRVGVQDITWYALVNSAGKVVWQHDGSNHWLSQTALEAQVSKAWAKASH